MRDCGERHETHDACFFSRPGVFESLSHQSLWWCVGKGSAFFSCYDTPPGIHLVGLWMRHVMLKEQCWNLVLGENGLGFPTRIARKFFVSVPFGANTHSLTQSQDVGESLSGEEVNAVQPAFWPAPETSKTSGLT